MGRRFHSPPNSVALEKLGSHDDNRLQFSGGV